MQACPFLESDGAGARDLTADLAIDAGGVGIDGIEEFDARAFFHPQAIAENGADNLSVIADDEVAGALDGAGERAEDGEVVAAQGGAGDDAGFLNDHIATGFDAAVPASGDFVIYQTNVTTTFRALAGLGFGDGGECISAFETANRPRWFGGVDQSHEERSGRRLDGAGTEFEARLGCRGGRWF